MAPPCGTRDKERDDSAGLLSSAARLIGFLMFAGPAMLILAALVLAPAWTNYVRVRHERDCWAAKVAQAHEWVEANNRFAKALETNDEMVNTRIYLSQTNQVPADPSLHRDPSMLGKPMLGVDAPPLTMPAPPQDRWTRLAARLENPTTRRGCFLIAIGAMLAAAFLFVPPPKKE